MSTPQGRLETPHLFSYVTCLPLFLSFLIYVLFPLGVHGRLGQHQKGCIIDLRAQQSRLHRTLLFVKVNVSSGQPNTHSIYPCFQRCTLRRCSPDMSAPRPGVSRRLTKMNTIQRLFACSDVSKAILTLGRLSLYITGSAPLEHRQQWNLR